MRNCLYTNEVSHGVGHLFGHCSLGAHDMGSVIVAVLGPDKQSVMWSVMESVSICLGTARKYLRWLDGWFIDGEVASTLS